MPGRIRLLPGLVALAVLPAACHSQPQSEPAPASAAWFTESARAAGLTFTHVNGMRGGHYMTEIIGGGVALLDYDGDGDLDVFFVQSQGTGRLFRNNLVESSRIPDCLTESTITAQLVSGKQYGLSRFLQSELKS